MLSMIIFFAMLDAIQSLIDLVHLIIVLVHGGVVGLEVIRYKQESKK